ncbi:MAG TPA: hypothetical protein DIT62_05555 [Alphaproteobacteria bacterium]|nr:hypothetical protein [Alphaproteobacteria bacterium]
MVKTLIPELTLMIGALAATMFILSGCVTVTDQWDNHKKKHHAKNLVYDAVEVIERDGRRALDQFNENPWNEGDAYLFVFKMDGEQVFHGIAPEKNGNNRLGESDINGVFVVESMIEVVRQNSSGWVTYHRESTETGEVGEKRSFVHGAMMDGDEVFVGSGYYHKE